MDPLYQTLLYLLIVAAVTASIAILILRRLSVLEDTRVESIKRRDYADPISTESPSIDSLSLTRERGIAGLEQRLRGIRRIAVPIVLLLGTVCAVLPFLNAMPAVYLSLIVGTLTVIVGFAAKPFVENMIAGVAITLSRSVKVGDTVTVSERYGTIEQIDLLYTTVKIWNWQRWVIPNSVLLSKEIQNHTRFDSFEWAAVKFFVAPDSNLEQVEHLAIEAMLNSHVLMDSEPPQFWVMKLDKFATECWVAGWVRSPADAWNIKHETRMRVASKLREAGIRTSRFGVPEEA